METPKPTQQPSAPARPKLPSKFVNELWKAYAKQQKRKVRTGTLPSASVDIPLDDYVSFSEYLKSSNRIMALLGAGLSAASGVPTFRGPGGFWREYDCMTLATPGAFVRDPALVWQFYNYRRHGALKAKPNRAHVALAELAKKRPNYLAISQNIDGAYVSKKRHGGVAADWPVHGSLFNIKCTNNQCDYVEKDNFKDPLVPALQLPDDIDISDAKIPLRDIAVEDLPHCPKCSSLLRPDIVWFGEALAQSSVERIHSWLDEGKVDLMLVVGTSALVYPAAGYIHSARVQGARVAVFNMEESEEEGAASNLKEGDWFFRGDASKIIPEVLKEVIGVVPDA
ncbi:NAD-dependent histone deacetylase silent information regulator Sir2 [Neofusicoccum parvum]|uniref:NAD-dependent histone deacetylase silent information regulator Sir2 n=1 Tax=Neofusicoccum parvum TaxID=310453 RepID=A0ACB5RUL5_9PEZI|nr:NAD-dependent histone deacetylase silent information regulator Sir2 [Neofusicoccum parvum]